MRGRRSQQLLTAALLLVSTSCLTLGLVVGGFRIRPLHEASPAQRAQAVQGVPVPVEQIAAAAQEAVRQEGLDENLKYEIEAEMLLEANGGRQVLPLSRVATTAKMSALTFSGLGDSELLSLLLGQLQGKRAHVTFFVSRKDIENYPEQVLRIAESGQHFGLLALSEEAGDARALLASLLRTKETLETLSGDRDILCVRQEGGEISPFLQEAASAAGLLLLGETLQAVPENLRAENSGQRILEQVMPETQTLQRGGIVHVEMKGFEGRGQVLSDVVRAMMDLKAPYPVRTVPQMLSERDKLYVYPLADEQILFQRRGAIHAGQLPKGDRYAFMRTRFLGQGWLKKPREMLPGFSQLETMNLDDKGKLTPGKEQVFLTFDGWTDDAAMTDILDVLSRHRVGATFFVPGSAALTNPNLVRAIAMEGHDIGSFTHTPVALARKIGKDNYDELTRSGLDELRGEMTKSYEALCRAVGDLHLNGKPVLTLYFRSPSEAIGRSSLETVLDMGYSYCIGGSFTTSELKVKSIQELALKMRLETVRGAVLVLHLGDLQEFLPRALDHYLTLIENQGDFRFVKISEVL